MTFLYKLSVIYIKKNFSTQEFYMKVFRQNMNFLFSFEYFAQNGKVITYPLL